MISLADDATRRNSFVGHNGGPPLSSRNFKRRWAEALFAHPKKPYGAIAMGFVIFMEMDSHGEGAIISDDDFKARCGVSDGSCRTFKKWLIEQQFIRIRMRGQRGRKSSLQAIIPGDPIPADVAASPDEIAAPIAVNQQQYRQPLPSIEVEIAAPVAAIDQLAADVAGIPLPASRAPALIENPSGLNTYIEVDSEVKKEKGKISAQDALDAFHRYNDLAQRVGLAVARSLTPERKRALVKRMNDNGGTPSWDALISNIDRSSFLQGDNDRGWKIPGLDWLLKSANFTKVIEGTYGNGAHAGPKESQTERIFRVCKEAEERMQQTGSADRCLSRE